MLPYIIFKASSSSRGGSGMLPQPQPVPVPKASAGGIMLPKGVAVPKAPSRRGYTGTGVGSFCAPDITPPPKKVPKLKGTAAASAAAPAADSAMAPAAASSGLGFNNSL